MATFDASDIIGKTLQARTTVEIKRYPEDAAPVVYTVKPGAVVGVVESYINPKPGRNVGLYWQFSDGNRSYYAEHRVGRYNVENLETQGAISLEDQKEAQEEANMSLYDRIGRWVGYIGAGLAAFVLIRDQLLKKR
jgi:hypothetical protein